MTMRFDPRSLFRHRAGSLEFTKVDQLVGALREQLAAAGDGANASDAMRGQLVGAELQGHVTLQRDPAIGSPRFQAGVFAGSLYAHLLRTRGNLDLAVMLSTAAYAASLLDPAVQRYLLETPLNLPKAHAYGCLSAAKRGNLSVDVELATFRWLAEQLSVPVTPELVRQVAESRRRLLDLQAAVESERSMDPAAASAARSERRIRAQILAIERKLSVTEPGSEQAERLRGALTGFTTASRSGLLLSATDGDESEAYRGGLLGGNLLASLVRGDRNPDGALRSMCYRYGAALASSKGRSLLAGIPPTSALMAHQLGMYAINEGGAGVIEEDLEIALLTWLATQLDVPPTPQLMSDRKRYVARPMKSSD
jgi:hypothetical protein